MSTTRCPIHSGLLIRRTTRCTAVATICSKPSVPDGATSNGLMEREISRDTGRIAALAEYDGARSPCPLFDVNVVVAGEPLPTLVVSEFAELSESFEELSPRRTRGEQHQHRGPLVGVVVPAVNTAGRDVHEVVTPAIGPLFSVVELDGP